MKKKSSYLFFIVLVSSILFKCSPTEKEEFGVKGYVVDKLGNPLSGVLISFKTDTITVQTDSLGNYTINSPKTCLLYTSPSPRDA